MDTTHHDLFWNPAYCFENVSFILDNKQKPSQYLSLVPYVVFLISALLSGWLADARFGHYYVAKTGIVLLFIAKILECVLYTSMYLTELNSHPKLLIALITVTNCVGYTGCGSCMVTLLQLGLDQMPDASAANITSFIVWFVFFVFAGLWIAYASNFIPLTCSAFSEYVLLWSLFPVLCMAIVLCSDFLLTPKWLIIEPKSPQSVKNIFLVLKFAKKHKAPVNRSSLTYWEEDIPSRIDLGKSKYGGPFTTEQVEDVKTILRMLAVSVPMSLSCLSLYLCQLPTISSTPINEGTPLTGCKSSVIKLFTYLWVWVVILIAFFEFALYPFVAHKIPTALKRIGVASFLVMLGNLAWLILNIIGYVKDISTWHWSSYPYSIIIAICMLLYVPSILEFMCAQSPYSMRGLLIGYVWFTLSALFVIAGILRSIFTGPCVEPYCEVIYCCIATLLSIIGFILYCVLAYWYKRRVRDDISTPHRWVEEVYDRYLVNEHQHDY